MYFVQFTSATGDTVATTSDAGGKGGGEEDGGFVALIPGIATGATGRITEHGEVQAHPLGTIVYKLLSTCRHALQQQPAFNGTDPDLSLDLLYSVQYRL